VQRMFEAFARREVEATIACMHPDIEFVPGGTNRLVGERRSYRGHEGMRRYFEDVEATWSELTIMPEDYRVTAGGVVVFGSVDGLPRGAPPRQRERNGAVWMWRLAGELIRWGSVTPTE
jgi:ketosteroid isomerase-like protein